MEAPGLFVRMADQNGEMFWIVRERSVYYEKSDAFETSVEEPELELKVTMININQGHNRELLEKCKVLREYSIFVSRVRDKAREFPIEKAVDLAVTECIQEGVLADILASQRAEVVAMSIFEYNEELEWKKIRKDEYEMGIADGEIKGKAESVLDLLNDLGTVSKSLHDRILAENDLGLLRKWLKMAARAESIEEFLGNWRDTL